MIRRLFESIQPYKSGIMVYGLALVPLLAGASKFIGAVAWTKPAFTSMLPVSAQAVSYGVGVVEVAAGIALLTRKRSDIVAGIIAVWLLGIVLQVAYYELWTIAIRDLGLFLFALSVALNEYEVRTSERL